jgi:small subunit ribosomal protein S3
MGQKVHPTGFRVGVTQGWQSRWFADKEYGRYVEEDFRMREYLPKNLLPLV